MVYLLDGTGLVYCASMAKDINFSNYRGLQNSHHFSIAASWTMKGVCSGRRRGSGQGGWTIRRGGGIGSLGVLTYDVLAYGRMPCRCKGE